MPIQLSQLARESWHQQREAEKARRMDEHGDRAVQLLDKVLELPAPMRGISHVVPAEDAFESAVWRDSLVLAIGDVRVACQIHEDGYTLLAIGHCPSCDEVVAVEPAFADLAGLGRALEEGTPVRHPCAAQS